ncbi:odorant receptor 67a-like [Odontomachus brunneus]|uniref:odorant receptor 67a-like n=1 Tax=Odontomachus brunneus TaxID=486640 RepID=UPI0013F28356|nr:odorant receptor 67a-like [Odontomachus brunneus]
MDFQNVNPLNVHTNFISGNLLPLAPGVSQFSIMWKLFSILMWLLQAIQVSVMIPGLFIVPWESALLASTITSVNTIEVFFMVGRILARRKLVDRLISKLNEILHVEDETMRNIVTTTLKPMNTPLKFYCWSGGLSILVWFSIPFLLISERSSFFYEDFKLPAVFSKQPFSTQVFLLGNLFLIIGNVHIFLKKCGVDIYMIHLVLLITSQYRYISTRLTTTFQDANLQSEVEGYSPETNRWTDSTLRALCQHHVTVIRLSSVLKELLSLSFTMIYVNSVLRFCFIGVLLSRVLSTTLLEGFLVMMFTCGCVVQFYILCFCVQQLQDASRNITIEAFHEKWYLFGPSVRRTFMLMILSNNLGCNLSTSSKFNLSLSSFMSILNQSYSIALVLL